jgi:MFS family permease
MSTWVSRTPAIRDALDLSNSEMGLMLGAVSVGSVIGIASGNPLLARRGARFVVGFGMVSMAVGVALIGLGTALQLGLIVAVGLVFFGCGMGSGEIGQNVEAVKLETVVGRSMVPALQGCYSFGIFAGGLAGLVANSLHVPVMAHLLAVALLIVAGFAWLSTRLPAATGAKAKAVDGIHPAGPRGRRFVWIDRRLVVLGVIILGMALSEGSANDWLPLIVVDGFGQSAALGSIIYAFFGLAVAVGRFCGGAAIDRFGRAPVMRVSALTAAVGIACVASASNLWIGGFGVLLWGLGTSLGFPVALSAAGEDARHGAQRVGLVVAVGYSGYLVGPPLLGFLGEHAGLRAAILVVLVAVIVSLFFSKATAQSHSLNREPTVPADRVTP